LLCGLRTLVVLYSTPPIAGLRVGLMSGGPQNSRPLSDRAQLVGFEERQYRFIDNIDRGDWQLAGIEPPWRGDYSSPAIHLANPLERKGVDCYQLLGLADLNLALAKRGAQQSVVFGEQVMTLQRASPVLTLIPCSPSS
jgi:hypothetical protein